MPGTDLRQLAEEAVRTEQYASDLYLIFFNAFPDDADFWWRLVIEEKNHAALIRSGLEYFLPTGRFPIEILPPLLEALYKSNQRLAEMIDSCRKKPPSRKEAFNMALRFENSVAEIHFQRAMVKMTDSEIMEIFQKLNRDDKDHAGRIRSYMEQKGIHIDEGHFE